MNVADFIDKLGKLPQDARVVIDTPSGVWGLDDLTEAVHAPVFLDCNQSEILGAALFDECSPHLSTDDAWRFLGEGLRLPEATWCVVLR